MSMVTVNGYKAMHSVHTCMTSNSVTTKVAGVILCGGRSSRMGVDKSELLLNGKTLLNHMQLQLQQAGINKVITAGKGDMPDLVPERGPLGSLHTALNHLQANYTHLVVVPVDMPLLTVELLQTLVNCKNDAEATHYYAQIMPLKISTTDNVVRIVSNLLSQDDTRKRSIKELLFQLRLAMLPITEHEHSLFDNTNTPDDWQRVTGMSL